MPRVYAFEIGDAPVSLRFLINKIASSTPWVKKER